MFCGIASLPRLNTYLLCIAQVPRLKMELHETSKLFHGSAMFPGINMTVLRINTRLLYGNKHLLGGNLDNTRIAPLNLLMLLVSGGVGNKLEY